jgi:Trypsin-co-occurring domain 1
MAPVLMKVAVDGQSEAADNDFILVEVDPQDAVGEIQLASDKAGGRSITEAQETLARSFDRLGPALSVMLRKLRSAENAPDHIQMEFGVKLGGSAGLIFAQGTAEANFAVTVTWDKLALEARPGAPGGAR